jgi:hypothetical protein
MLAGRRLVVPTGRDRLSAWAARLAPRPLVLAVAGRLFRPPRAAASRRDASRSAVPDGDGDRG